MDREQERVDMVREHRIDAYVGLMRILQNPKNLSAEPMARVLQETGILIRLWGSNEVTNLFMTWANLMPTGFGPDKNDAQDAKILTAANRTRDRMAQELQGVLP